MIIQDFLDHKDDPVPHRLIITGPDPIPVELPGPAIDNDSGRVIYRQDLKTTQEEADTIIVQQVINSWWFIWSLMRFLIVSFQLDITVLKNVWFQAAHHRAGDKALVVVADDTDVFLLLLHFRHCGSIQAGNIYMESPMKGRAVIDIDATVCENLSIIPGLLAAHALSGCDTVASHYGIGKGIVLKVLREGKEIVLYCPSNNFL